MSIIFLERHDAEKRKNGWRAAGEALSRRAQRPRPFDFEEVAKKLEYRRPWLRDHYHTRNSVVERWAAESGMELQKGSPPRVVRPKDEREFDPARDNALLRMAVGALTLTSHRHRPR